MNTELVIFNKDFEDIGVLVSDVDFEVGTSEALNNFELHSPSFDAHGFYIEGTEYGGVVEYEHGGTEKTEQTYKGWTWRGLLMQDIVMPPSGSDYRVVSGEANTILRSMLSNVLGGFFVVPEKDSGCVIANYQFALYINLLDGLMDMLAQNGYRLHIHAEKEQAAQPVRVYVEAVPITTVEGTYNEDSPVKIEYTYNSMGINHLICMGRGELQARQRVDLYINENGEVSQTQTYTGFAERTAFYDYSSAESTTELIKYGTQRLLELASSRSIGIEAKDKNTLEIGDMVRAVKGGESITAPIVRKVLRVEREAIVQEYTVKGEQ